MEDVWVNKALSFAEAEAFDVDYYLGMGPEERISEMQRLRDQYAKFKQGRDDACGERLRRSVRIIQQT